MDKVNTTNASFRTEVAYIASTNQMKHRSRKNSVLEIIQCRARVGKDELELEHVARGFSKPFVTPARTGH